MVDSENSLWDSVCVAFAEAWSSNRRPDLAGYLERCVNRADQQELFRRLVEIDIAERRRLGESPSVDEYVARFPQFADAFEGGDGTASEESGGEEDVTTVDHESPSGEALPRTAVKHFKLLERIGSGATADVFKAIDTQLERTVAVKMPRGDLGSDEEVDRFLREGQAAAQLRHEHIVAVHEVGRCGESAYIVSDFVAGTDLRKWLRNNRLDWRKAAVLCRKLATALHHAHEQGVIHRDFKPANVLIDDGMGPHITDFGLAKLLHGVDITGDGRILGTPAYMSPEQASGNSSRVDRRADVYAVGVLLYELLTGSPPFRGDPSTVYYSILNHEPRSPRNFNPSLPRDIETICLKAMAKRPDDRYASAEDLAEDLRRLLGGEPILARPAGYLEVAWRWLRRHPAATVAAALGLTTAAALIALLAIFTSPSGTAQRVHIATDPPGARIAFVPLNESTGEPDTDSVTFGSTISPMKVLLEPGDYLVIAALSEGRFHEVFRRVPGDQDLIVGPFDHESWIVRDDGSVELPVITIPPASVNEGMVLIPGDESFRVGVEGELKLPPHTRSVASFFIDPHEFSRADLVKIEADAPQPGRGNRSVPASYDQAVAYAEAAGKRLPTEFEYEFVATARGTSRFPWGDTIDPAKFARPEPGDLAPLPFDTLDTKPPVLGLCSGLGEWTTSRPLPYPPRRSSTDASNSLGELRVVRGWLPPQGDGEPQRVADPRQRYPHAWYTAVRTIGFRAVRSAEPIVPFAEFP